MGLLEILLGFECQAPEQFSGVCDGSSSRSPPAPPSEDGNGYEGGEGDDIRARPLIERDVQHRAGLVHATLAALSDLHGMSTWLHYERTDVWTRWLALYQHCDELWNAPLQVFKAALAEFDQAFREAFALYQLHVATIIDLRTFEPSQEH